MMLRQPTYAQKICAIKVEMANRTASLERCVAEVERLKETASERDLTKAERKRAEDLFDIIQEHTKFIMLHAPEVKAFYAPASIGA